MERVNFHSWNLVSISCDYRIGAARHQCHIRPTTQALIFFSGTSIGLNFTFNNASRKWLISLSCQRVCGIINAVCLNVRNVCIYSRSHWLTQVMRYWRRWGCCFYFRQCMKSANWGENYTFAIICASVLGDVQEIQLSSLTKFMVTWNDVWASSFHSHGSSFLWLCLSFFSSFSFANLCL